MNIARRIITMEIKTSFIHRVKQSEKKLIFLGRFMTRVSRGFPCRVEGYENGIYLLVFLLVKKAKFCWLMQCQEMCQEIIWRLFEIADVITVDSVEKRKRIRESE